MFNIRNYHHGLWIILFIVSPIFLFGQETFRDNFSSIAYDNNDGTQNFSSNWVETFDDGTPNNGRIRINGSNRLRFRNLDGRTIRRTLDLSGASAVELTFDYDATEIGDQSLFIQLWNDTSSAFETVATINTDNTGSVSHTLTVDQISANSEILIQGGYFFWDSDEYVFLDNVLFTATFGPTLSIGDLTVNEGNGNAVFTVTHSGTDAAGPFTVNYQTIDGTANAGNDYTFTSGPLNFNGTAGDVQTITVPILDDGDLENSETFGIQFSSVTDATVNISDTATATITDNDAFVMTDGATVNTCSGTFVDTGGISASYANNEVITYTICPDISGADVIVEFTSFDVESGYDFLYVYEGTSTSGTLIGQYHNGNIPTTITSTDSSGCLTFRFESDFSVTNSGWEATISCMVPSPTITIEDISVFESAGVATFTATHVGVAAAGPFTVNYQTVDGSALAGSDYTSTSGSLSFDGNAGDFQTISVPISNDGILEFDENFSVQFTATSDSSVNITDTATATINSQVQNDVPLALLEEFDGYLDYTSTGGSLRTQDNNTNSCAVTTSSSATLINSIPATATIEKAYLYWVHSSYTLDGDITFEGQSVTADLVYQTDLTNRTFFGYVSDVTSIVSAIPDPSTNTYDFSDLTIDTNDPYCSSSTVLGAWALLIFYEDASLPPVNINLYQGFDGLSNTGTSFTLDAFYAISGSGSKASFLSWEGDDTLDGSSSGSTNPEELSITNQAGNTFVLSGDGGQTGNNAYNSTIYDNTQTPVYNDATTYGLDWDTFDISSYIAATDTQVTANVDVGQDFVISNVVVLRVPSNLITGTVFEDVNYPGGAGRSLTSSSGVGVENATVELYNSSNNLVQTRTTDASGGYTFGGMPDDTYYVRVINASVRSSRGGGSACTDCLPIQTFRRYDSGSGLVDVTDEVGGVNPSGEDVAAGILSGAQTVTQVGINSSGAVDLDFGFNFNTIVNTNDTGQGSLAQFIVNANTLGETGLDIEANGIFDPSAGEDTSIFMIPSSSDPLGRTADVNFNGNYFDVYLSSANPLPAITGDNTVLDGRTQTAYSGDTNSGTIGSGGALVGALGATLPNFELPEIQVHRDNGDVLTVQGNDVTIRNLSVYANSNSGIRVDTGRANIYDNVLAVDATGSNAGNIAYAIENVAGNINVVDNYIATAADAGIWIGGGTASLIQTNQISNIGDGPCDDAITITAGSGISIQQNLIEASASTGIDAEGASGSISIVGNSITTSGQDGRTCTGNIEDMAIKLDGDNSQLANNSIYSNGGSGIVVIGGTGNQITQNSIYSNGTNSDAIGIDLDASSSAGDGITINDNGDADSGPNGLLNFPILSDAIISGNTLIVRGWSRAGATIELFFTDINEGTALVGDNQLGFTQDYGEGQTFIASLVEGSASDTDTTISAYSDSDGNAATTNRFGFSIPLPSGMVPTALLTATATLSNSTSEFGPFVVVKVATIITNRRITYRVNN